MNPGTKPVSNSHSEETAELLQILSGKYRTQALSTLASLGVPDLLAAEPRSLASLSDELKCDASRLDRLLRFTVGLGFLASEEPNLYSLTSLGKQLCSDALGPLATFVGSPEQWDPWARLRDSLSADS